MRSLYPLLHLLMLNLAMPHLISAASECVEGYIMDTFCADRGRLLDSPGTNTLTEPQQHSLHCLVDVEVCYSSGFEVLESPRSGSNIHCRVFKLDDAGNELVLQKAREEGNTALGCKTCGSAGTLERGYQAALVGTPEGTGAPRLFKVKSIHAYGTCNLLTLGNSGLTLAQIDDSMRLCSSRDVYIQAHGALMVVGWGFLLPLGVATAAFGKRHDPLWFFLHLILQLSGLAIGVAGWTVALSQFQVLDQWKPQGSLYAHACMGVVVMCLGLLQPINAFFRPHKAEPGDKRTCLRLAWEIVHKSFGYISIVLGVGTAAVGALHSRYAVSFLGALGASIISVIAAGVLLYCCSPKFSKGEGGGRRHLKGETKEPEVEKGNERDGLSESSPPAARSLGSPQTGAQELQEQRQERGGGRQVGELHEEEEEPQLPHSPEEESRTERELLREPSGGSSGYRAPSSNADDGPKRIPMLPPVSVSPGRRVNLVTQQLN
uniref:Cytochrome b561 domain-containing protein n=1 Tax=Chromera velia CCMP2878 TaxID=1169474 RepID=A0A0G4HMB7_9ALVE|eukprot:Cvel_7478.t1-p1 / transcript=Cvel_7478.t1 / gene=Cvel_7478 / organism=Chromera_velia_CCMP2878 / gene_product=hypothetical protein / transcript_product=hypothetical protein / location=Cvel_scaffold391:90392-91858(-) / protein_length=489 / sequence_SO=supercontig / SO=protein_coding / is_pseudo=false